MAQCKEKLTPSAVATVTYLLYKWRIIDEATFKEAMRKRFGQTELTYKRQWCALKHYFKF